MRVARVEPQDVVAPVHRCLPRVVFAVHPALDRLDLIGVLVVHPVLNFAMFLFVLFLSQCVQGLAKPGPPRWEEGTHIGHLWMMVLPLLISACPLVGHAWISKWRGCCHSPPRGPARWVWGRAWRLSRRCRHPKSSYFWLPWNISKGAFLEGVRVDQLDLLLRFLGGEKMFIFWEIVLRVCKLLDILGTAGEPAPGHHDVYSVKYGQNHRRTTFSPYVRHCYLVSKRTLFFSFGIWWFGCCTLAGPDIRVWLGTRRCRGHLSVEFLNVGGWLTNGDMALDSSAQFLAAAEQRLIPVRAGLMGHQLRRAERQSVWAPACQDHISDGYAGVGVDSLCGTPSSASSLVTLS